MKLPPNPRTAAWQEMRRLPARSVNMARRIVSSLPVPLRAKLHGVVARSDRLRPPPPIEGWSRPLIGNSLAFEASDDGLITAPGAVIGSGVVEPTRSGERAGSNGAEAPALRCLLMTGALDVGGMDEVVAFLARRLPAYGVTTAVLHVRPDPSPTGEPSGRLGRMLRASGIEVYEADESGVRDWIKRWHPDVISAHGALPPSVLAFAKRAGVPYVDTFHGMHDLFSTDWRAEAARGTALSAIVSVCELVRRQYLAGNPGFPPERIIAINNAVDDERRPAGNRVVARGRLGLTDEYLFVSLARHCLQKNSYGLVTAFAELAQYRPEVHLVIAGRLADVRYYRRVLRLRDSLPCRDRIHLREHVAAPAELLAAADGFVLNSFFEGCALASMEALCAGVPVVLSDAGMAREQIDDDRTRGYLAANPLGDPLKVDWESIGEALYRPQVNRGEFATAMEHLVANRKDYLGGREQLAVESAVRFRADVCLAQHAAVLRSVATGGDLRALVNDGPDRGH